eukprot:1326249-Amorphochlora_amoeboformis.AAC.1
MTESVHSRCITVNRGEQLVKTMKACIFFAEMQLGSGNSSSAGGRLRLGACVVDEGRYENGRWRGEGER